ncbi:MAG: 4-hydroxybenzoate octaprenyltransferase [Planctomycetia bacterium]|nr:4-hydroxybenzoate octaprenyltransferase [Planctomycetia bacterium]
MLQRLRHFLELIRFSHTVFALPFALLAALMAWHARAARQPPEPWRWQELIGLVLCMVFARSTAMAFNRLADRKIDALNPRTQNRHLPRRLLTVPAVAAFTLICAAAFVTSTLLFLPNRWPLYLSVPVLAFICGYSYAKRFTSLAHFWLGAALMLAPVCAWLAISGFEGILPAVVLGGAVLFWVSGFDIIYACQDYDADVKSGLKSVPARLGLRRALRIAAGCHLVTLGSLFALPAACPALGWIYYAGLGLVAVLLLYEHLLVRPDDLTRVNVAFFNVNAVIGIGLLAVGAADLWL